MLAMAEIMTRKEGSRQHRLDRRGVSTHQDDVHQYHQGIKLKHGFYSVAAALRLRCYARRDDPHRQSRLSQEMALSF